MFSIQKFLLKSCIYDYIHRCERLDVIVHVPKFNGSVSENLNEHLVPFFIFMITFGSCARLRNPRLNLRRRYRVPKYDRIAPERPFKAVVMNTGAPNVTQWLDHRCLGHRSGLSEPVISAGSDQNKRICMYIIC